MKKKLCRILCLAVALVMLLAGCSKEVAVDASGLKNSSLTAEATAVTGTDFTATITADEHYELPEAVSITIDGAVLTEGYTYDSATGVLTVSGDAITGDITISAQAEESILGNWSGSVDISELVNTMMGDVPETADYFSFSDITFDMEMTFLADGSCSVAVTEESLKNAYELMIQQVIPGMKKMLEDILAAGNIDMTVDEFLAASNMSLEDMIRESIDEDSLDEIAGGLVQEGYYTLADGILYITDEKGEEPGDDDATPYTLENGVLTIQAPEDMEEEAAAMFPLVLKRAS